MESPLCVNAKSSKLGVFQPTKEVAWPCRPGFQEVSCREGSTSPFPADSERELHDFRRFQVRTLLQVHHGDWSFTVQLFDALLGQDTVPTCRCRTCFNIDDDSVQTLS